jgi:hypothetical protein
MRRLVEVIFTRVMGPTPSAATCTNRTNFFSTTAAFLGIFIVVFFLTVTLEASFAR